MAKQNQWPTTTRKKDDNSIAEWKYDFWTSDAQAHEEWLREEWCASAWKVIHYVHDSYFVKGDSFHSWRGDAQAHEKLFTTFMIVTAWGVIRFTHEGWFASLMKSYFVKGDSFHSWNSRKAWTSTFGAWNPSTLKQAQRAQSLIISAQRFVSNENFRLFGFIQPLQYLS